ncbi:MAG: hypothetical protein H0X35_16400 [Pseudonocardiales bacterium]|nr:hypothetical protein [Pseudonocardiales bacterium]
MDFVLIVDLPPSSVQAFRAYEDRVLPLLSRHAGRLDRRLRTADGLTEVHLLSFASQAAYDGYVADPERQAHRALLDGVALEQRLLEVTDV